MMEPSFQAAPDTRLTWVGGVESGGSIHLRREKMVVENLLKMAPKSKFREGKRVLCIHGHLLYEAKCVKIFIKDKQVKYFAYYSGWNKNWDACVPESRVLKYMETNVQKQNFKKPIRSNMQRGRWEGPPHERCVIYKRKMLESPRNGNGSNISEIP